VAKSLLWEVSKRKLLGAQSGYNQSASSIFGKDIEYDFPKEIKTEIKFAFVKNVGEAL